MMGLLTLGVVGAGGTAAAQSSFSFSGTTNVTASTTGTATVTITASGTVNTISVLTMGAANLDFTAGTPSGTCTTGSVTAGNTCTYGVTFSPKYPGLRNGAVVLFDASGTVLGTGMVNGVGVASLSVMETGELTTVAGNGYLNTPPPDNIATDNSVAEPMGVAFDGAGNMYYSDRDQNLVRKVTPAGILSTVAGTGTGGYAGDGGAATAAELSAPSGLIVDGAGNIYIADSGNNVIREVVMGSGTEPAMIYTVAGNGTAGSSNGTGMATSGELNGPQGLALDPGGNLFIADTVNNLVRKVNATTKVMTTYAGTGSTGTFALSGLATSIELNEPWGLYATSDGSVYIADYGNNVIRKVDTSGNLTTVVGSGSVGYNASSGPVAANTTAMDHPTGVVVDAAGNIIYADSENDAILKMNNSLQTVTRLGGNENPGWDADGVDANPSLAEFNKPYGLALDGAGDLLIADRINLRVRKISGTVGALTYAALKETQTSPPQPQVIENDGNATLNFTSIEAVAGPTSSNTNAAIDATGTTCVAGTPVTQGASCTIEAEFQPEDLSVSSGSPSTQQPVVGEIAVVSDSANSAVQVDVSGISDSIFPTTTVVTSNVSPSALGQTITFTATMTTSNTSWLTGTVTFYDNGVEIGGAAQNLNATGNTATLTISTLTLGSHPITAVYSGDSGDATSTSAAYTQVVKQGTTVAVIGSPNASLVYGAVTVTATVTQTAGSTTPGGTVTFSVDGNVASAAITMVSGNASFNTSTLTAGTHTISAAYSGDTNDLNSSGSYSQTVNVAVTSSTLATSATPVLVETSVTFTATVTGNAAGAVPSGSVYFYDGSTRIGIGALTGSGYVGTATFTTASLTAGTHSITAVYQGDGNYGMSSTAALPQTVNKIATAATVAASANATIAGATASFTVTVTAASSTTPNVPVTGTVTVMDGTVTLGWGTVTALGTGPATATVTVTSSALGVGSHAITANYAGDGNYLASASTAMALTVANAGTTTALGESAGTIIAQKPVTFTATVAGTGGTPTGTVTFLDGGVSIGTGSMHSGVAVVTTSGLAVGTHTITASYGGDSNDAVSTSNAVTVVVQSATTATALGVTPNPADHGQSVTMTATVTGNGGTPGGSVTFLDGGAPLGAAVALNVGGVANFTTTALNDGTHTITASYAGDANDTGSASSSVSLKVLQTATLTVQTTTGNPAAARTDVHLVATLTPLQGLVPTGTVTFLDGGTAIGTGTLSGSAAAVVATFDTTTLAVGTHEITVAYAGDGTTEAVTSAAYPMTIAAVGSSVTVAASANPAVFGQVLTFTAGVTSTTGVPTGTVKFEDAGTVIGQGTLSGGKATFATSALAAGPHTIEAVYSGDSDDEAGTSPAITVVVQRATTTVLTSSANPLQTLAPVVITATVNNGGGTAATGTVSFTEDGNAVGTATLTGGTATLSLTSLPVGNHVFTASYAGDAIDIASASASFTQAVQLRPTTDVLTSSATSLTGGQQVTLISVVQYLGPSAPTGTVVFMAGSLAIGTETVNASGIATVTALLGNGPTVNVTAIYSGDQNYATSTSPITAIAIGPAPDFYMSLTPSTFSLVTKNHAPLAITLTSVNNFTDTFALGCAGLPFGASCTFTKDSVLLPAGGTATVTLTVDTGDPLGSGTSSATTTSKNRLPKVFGNTSSTVMACFVPGCFLMGLLGLRMRRFRKVSGLLLLLCLMGATTVLSGCAGLNMSGTPAGSYNFRVTATGATGIEQSINVSMTVTN